MSFSNHSHFHRHFSRAKVNVNVVAGCFHLSQSDEMGKVGSLQDFFVQNQGFNFILYVGVTQEKGNAFSQQRNKS
jgi:hypothetical protein